MWCLWYIELLDAPMPDCIEGTRVSELIAIDMDRDETDLVRFQGGQWIVKPDRNLSRVIQDRLTSQFDGWR
jgi:hypothetical protein